MARLTTGPLFFIYLLTIWKVSGITGRLEQGPRRAMTIDDVVHRELSANKRRAIETVERLITDNDKHMSFGLPRTYLERHRADKFRDLLDYQLRTYRK